jgi:restriction system protein
VVTLLLAPLRLKIVRLLAVLIVLVAALASVSWFIADGWTDDANGTTVAFLLVFAAAIVGVIVLWRAAVTGRARRDRTLDGLLRLSPSDFEIAVARLMRRNGYRDVSVVGGSGDLAADIVARTKRGQDVVVQCKRKAHGQRVGSSEMQKFIGMVSVHHGADHGIFVTTSDYTLPAVELAQQHGILLIDGNALADIAGGRRRMDRDAARAA